MKTRVFVALAMAGIGNASLPAEVEEEAATVTKAYAQFQKNCMSCHQPPDLRFATDQAWIGQIRQTA